jgi:Ca2+-binding EF-hand superfamily protein
MLLDLAVWVDQKASGTINYMDFIDAFHILDVDASLTSTPTGKHGAGMPGGEEENMGVNAVTHMMEQLCAIFFQHRWNLQRAFEYFDANGDGWLTPEE